MSECDEVEAVWLVSEEELLVCQHLREDLQVGLALSVDLVVGVPGADGGLGLLQTLKNQKQLTL